MRIAHSSTAVRITATKVRQTAKTDFGSLLGQYQKRMRELERAHRKLSRDYEQMCQACILDLRRLQAAYKQDMASLGDCAAKHDLGDLDREAKRCAACLSDETRGLMKAFEESNHKQTQATSLFTSILKRWHETTVGLIRNLRA